MAGDTIKGPLGRLRGWALVISGGALLAGLSLIAPAMVIVLIVVFGPAIALVLLQRWGGDRRKANR